jgi:metallo-beta-lactamase family protein
MSSPSASDFPGPTVTFWGAAQAVTGSMHLVEAGGRKILLDCGLVRGARWEAHPTRRSFPFQPHEIDAVVLSHAHIDHCGHLPHLVRQGFAGPIYCTPATRDLVALMLADSARLREEDAFVQSVLGHAADPEPQRVSWREEVHRTLRQCIAVPYHQPYDITGDIQLRLLDAGHILGSAMVVLRIAGGRDATLVFTGDLGRRGSTLLHDPEPVPRADLVISESTYGGRRLDPLPAAEEKLAALVSAAIERGGKALIPAFSLGRTQLIVHFLQDGIRQGRLPAVPIFVDSPLAASIADVHRRYSECLNETAVRTADDGQADVHFVGSSEESKEVSARREPCVIVAPSGMCDGGRIVYHLKHHIDDPRCNVVLVSYQAPHSLGRRLLLPGPRIRIHGRFWNRWADVVELPGCSGHPDQEELLKFLTPLAGTSARVRLIHGELEQAEALARALRVRGVDDVAVPAPGETVRLR